jgi:hypothetical protein
MIHQEAEFIRPIFEERFAQMKEYGEDWDNRPVCRNIFTGLTGISLNG